MNTLLQEAVLATKNISHAAIIRRKDGAIKAKSTGFNLTEDEFGKMEHAFNHPKDARMSENALSFMDLQFKAVRADELAVYGKNDKNGVIIARTQSYYIIGMYDPTMYPSVAAEAIERLADYFRKKNK